VLDLAVHAPLLDDPLQVITDPAGWLASWLWPAIFGKDAVGQPDWAASLFSRAFFFTGLDSSQCTAPGGSGCSTFNIWSALQTTGYLVLAMAMMLRLVRTMLDEDRRVNVARHLLVDVVLRGSLAIAAINVSYALLAMLMHSSIVLGGVLFDTVMSITTAGAGGEAGLRHALAGIISPATFPIPVILETFALLYLLVLLLASRLAIIFAIAVAPLVIPFYAYSEESSVLLWWLKLIAQGLLVPILVGTLLPVAMIVIQAANAVNDGELAALLGMVTTIVSMWFIGHAITRLLGHLFPEHRSFLHGAANAYARGGFVANRVRGAVGPLTALVRR